jgi:iron complex outermembrane receptor protein
MLGVLVCWSVASLAVAQDEGADATLATAVADQNEDLWEDDFGDLSLEDLLEIPVTSVSGVARPLADTPAAAYVITAEDIRRGGHRTIADALRMVPGVQVAQVSSSIWAISARGFNDRFSTKLLVLVDGRVGSQRRQRRGERGHQEGA